MSQAAIEVTAGWNLTASIFIKMALHSCAIFMALKKKYLSKKSISKMKISKWKSGKKIQKEIQKKKRIQKKKFKKNSKKTVKPRGLTLPHLP